MVPDDPHHPRRLPVRGRRRLQEGRGPLRRRAQPPRPREDAAHRLATCCSSTSPPTTSTSTPRRSCSTPSPTTAGTLVFVSHDRYFVDRLATKVIEVGGGEAPLYPGGYEDFLVLEEAAGARRRRLCRRRDDARTWTTGPPRSRRRRSRRRAASAPEGRLRPQRPAAPEALAASREAQGRTRSRSRASRPAATPAEPPGPPPAPVRPAPPERQVLERELKKTKARLAELEKRVTEKEQAVKDARGADGRARLLRRPGDAPPRPPRSTRSSCGRPATSWPSGRPSRPRSTRSPAQLAGGARRPPGASQALGRRCHGIRLAARPDSPRVVRRAPSGRAWPPGSKTTEASQTAPRPAPVACWQAPLQGLRVQDSPAAACPCAAARETRRARRRRESWCTRWSPGERHVYCSSPLLHRRPGEAGRGRLSDATQLTGPRSGSWPPPRRRPMSRPITSGEAGR